ncbi:unnamed protein product [Protopolystoma xenopodis]|uniref:Uncharacterized protein n=1 Tax=Protopolystoma xenopodis TaxID=117903 RepID=A0A3S4ZQR1_9PLAT|nr:unnamed protein product [Protopolystoma xenopodis]
MYYSSQCQYQTMASTLKKLPPSHLQLSPSTSTGAAAIEEENRQGVMDKEQQTFTRGKLLSTGFSILRY